MSKAAVWRMLLISAACGLPALAAAQSLRQGPYANAWEVEPTKYVVQIDGPSYAASILTGSVTDPVATPIASGPIGELQRLNDCQFRFRGVLMTQQACSMAYDDSNSALRPDGTLVLPDVWFHSRPGVEEHYRAELVQTRRAGAAMALRVVNVEPSTQRSSDPRFFNAEQGRLDVTVFVPTAQDCIETYAATLVRAPDDGSVFVVSQLSFMGQYQWWGGGNDAACPVRPVQALIR